MGGQAGRGTAGVEFMMRSAHNPQQNTTGSSCVAISSDFVTDSLVVACEVN